MEGPAWALEALQVTLTAGDGDGPGLELRSDRLRLGADYAISRLQARCSPVRIAASGIRCTGGRLSLVLADGAPQTVDLDLEYGAAAGEWRLEMRDLQLAGGRSDLTLVLGSARWQVRLRGRHWSLTDAAALAERLGHWPAGYVATAGTVDLALSAEGGDDGPRRLDLSACFAGTSLAGANVAEDLDGEFSLLAERRGAVWQGTVRTELSGGLAYLEPGLEVEGIRPGFLLDAAAGPIRLAVEGAFQPDVPELRLDRFALRHPGVVQAEGSARIRLGDVPGVEMLALEAIEAEAEGLYRTYLQPWLLSTPLSDLELSGRLRGRARIVEGAITRAALSVESLYLDDRQGRFRIYGLNGELLFSDGERPLRSRLEWEGGGVYRVDLGAGFLGLESSAGALRLVDWGDLPILDGTLRMESLKLDRALEPDRSLSLDGVLTPISLERFTQAMGWPLMSGSLSGVVPGLSYQDGRLRVEGTLLMQVFDGDVTVRNLAVDDLFGLIPVLRADIELRNLDLETLTRTFAFGRIEGRVGGHVAGLRLESWQPVAFDAFLGSPPGDRSRRRISQRAIDNLTALGGGGAATGALSRTVFQVFDEFSYDAIGLSCRLEQGVCRMDGVGPSNDGYYIVRRGLLPPWIDVIGYNRAVDWDVLVERLRNITRAEGPIIQ